MTSVLFRIYAGVWTSAAATGAIALMVIGCQRAWATWRHARDVIRKTQEELSAEPVPYWPAENVALLTALCQPCRDGDGDCMCPMQCGQLACMGGFSDKDVRFLRGLTMPEGTDQ